MTAPTTDSCALPSAPANSGRSTASGLSVTVTLVDEAVPHVGPGGACVAIVFNV